MEIKDKWKAIRRAKHATNQRIKKKILIGSGFKCVWKIKDWAELES